MLCSNCGAENAEGTKFCANCGFGLAEPVVNEEPVVSEEIAVEAPVAAELSEQPEAPKEGVGVAIKSALNDLLQIVKPLADKVKPFVAKNKLLLAGIAGGVALILIACIVIGILTAGNGYTDYKHAIEAMVDDETVYILYDNKVIKTDIETEDIEQTASSLDGSIFAFLTEEGELVVVRNKKYTVVEDDVAGFYMSVNGNGIVYGVEEDEEQILYLYNVKSKKSTKISDDGDNISGIAISPDGKSVVYGLYDEEDEETDIMYFKGSKSSKVTSGDFTVVGMSNNGKQIYMIERKETDTEDLFDITYQLNCYNKKGDKEKLGEVDNLTGFNEDHTQILFTNEGKTYLSAKGKAAVKISNSTIRPLVAPNAKTQSSMMGTTYPISNLYNKVFVGYDSNSNYSAWYIKKNADKSVKLVSDVSVVKLDSEAEYLYYIDEDDELKTLKISHGDKASDKAKTLAEDVDSYVVTSDRKKVYFVSDGGLYSCNGKNGGSKKTIASDDVSTQLAINKKDVVYYAVDSDLYACSNGKKGTRVLSDAEYMESTPNGLVYASDEDSIYVSNGSKKLKKIWTSD